ncbi:bifunctional ornithine acetyltransferase/N-acetylglutamate synthase [Streptomyces sp. NPDC093097]|uniref:bifunctional ornithine acetyltransferase/N-acetylglutamate synthase n=1 Tax=Streptomyces sp. NPDC093097 TaxID=3366027 RepID=UPI0037FC6ECF
MWTGAPAVGAPAGAADPNWGRVLMAIGKNTEDRDIVPDRVTVAYGDTEVYPAEPTEDVLARLGAAMRRSEVEIAIGLGLGDGRATVFGCDLSAGYVRVNADYTT